MRIYRLFISFLLKNYLYICVNFKKMKAIKCVLGFVLLFLVTSCSLTESLIINENGTVNYSFELDASALAVLAGEGESTDDAGKKNVDSIISFKEILDTKKDSIAKLSIEEQANLKKLEKFKIHILVNEDKKEVKYTMFTELNSIAELNDLGSPLQSAIPFSGATEKDLPQEVQTAVKRNNNTAQEFFYDGKKFKKTIKVEKVNAVNASEENMNKGEFLTVPGTESKSEPNEEEVTEKVEESMKSLLDPLSLKTNYTFPKPVKKVISNYEVQYSEDRKTITIEIPFNDYMDDVEKSNLEIEFL